MFSKTDRFQRASALSLAIVGLFLSACAPQRPLIPPPLELARSEGNPVAPQPEAATQTRITSLPTAPGAAPLDRPLNVQASVEPQGKPAAHESSSINLEQVALGTFAQLVYADVLKKNVNVDPQVQQRKDLVTFRSGTGQTAAQLETAVKLLLKSYGVSAVDLGGLIRIVPDGANAGNLPEIRRGTALPDTPLPLRPVFQLVELKAVRNADVAGWLRTLFGDRIRSQEDTTRNAVLLNAPPDVMEAALEAIRVLDQPTLSGVQSAAITPAFWPADELARRLFDVLSAQGYAVQPLNQAPGGVRYPIILLPVSGLNAVYVFARGEDVLKHVTEWARTLDKPNERGIGKTYFTYAVKHKDAAALAATLDQLLTGRPAAAVATGQAAAPTSTGTPVRATTSVVVDRSTNMLIFQATADEYPQIVTLLQTLDRPSKTALVEVTLAELQLDDKTQTGVEWFTRQAVGAGGVVNVTSGNLNATVDGGLAVRVFDRLTSLRGVVNLLASNNKATVLSSPRIMARNGETATIQVGDEVPIITSQLNTGTTATTTSTQNQVLQTVQYRNTGVILKIKPVIHSGDQVDLDVTQEVSVAKATSAGVTITPTFGTRKYDTKLTLRNGSTVLLGGLISDEGSTTNAGIPLLKDIPLVGQLFSDKTRTGNRRELIVLITPYVINNDEDARSVTEAFRNMLGPWAGAMKEAPVSAVRPVVPLTEGGNPQ